MLDVARPYPACKDSGLPWLGEVPEHWELRRGKTLFTKANRAVRPEDETVTCFRDGQVTLRKNRRTTGFTEAIAEHGYQGVRKGDLVIHAMDAFAGAVGVSDSDGKASPICGIGIPNHLAIATYFAYAVREMARRQWILALAKGIRERSTDFRFDTFGNQFLPTPPIDEQAAIVKVLSAVDRRVNRLVRAKRRLLALLAEQKQAVVTHAVTRGLDPNAPTKPSGVPWLGEVPAHWEMTPNRQLLVLKKKLVGSSWEDYTLLSLTKRGIIERDMENPEGKFPSSFDTYQVVEPGDFVFCLFDIDETPRTVGLSELCGMITGAYTRFVCRRDEYAKFIYYYYLAMDSSKSLKPLYTGLRKVIQKSTFRAAPVPLPPVDEAQRIVATIEDAIEKIDAAADLARREIDLIREYRTRLVADVVTGKLDVRAVADALPDEAEEEEPIDLDEGEADADAGEPELVEELASH